MHAPSQGFRSTSTLGFEIHQSTHAYLEADDATFARLQRRRELPAQYRRADSVRRRGEEGVAIGAGGAGDVFEALREAVGNRDAGDRLAARVAIFEVKGDDVADVRAFLV